MCISNVGDQMSSPTVSFVIKNIDTKTSSLDIYIKGRANVCGLKGDNASLEDTPIVEESFAVGMDADSVGFIHTFVWLLKTSLRVFCWYSVAFMFIVQYLVALIFGETN